VPTDHSTIQAAIDAADPGDEIQVADGTYTISATLNINKSLSIIGESESGVIIDASAVNGYGINIEASDVTLQNFTVLPNPNSNDHYCIKANPATPPTIYANLTLGHITINGSRRSAFDIHGYDNVVLSNLTATGTTRGVGLAVSGCHDVDMSYITTSGNAWGGVAVYVSKPQYINRGSDNVNLNFANSTLADGIYSEDEAGLFNTNIHISGYTYGINNEYATNENIEFYIGGTLADALDLGAGFNAKYNNKMSYVWANADPIENYYVGPGMAIQAAIDAATPGDVINVANGTYQQTATLDINKGLSIIGESESGVIIDASTVTSYGIQIQASNVTLQNFTVLPNPDANDHYCIKANPATPPTIYANLTLGHITINGSRRSAFDIHGYDNVVLSNLTATGTTRGVGLAVAGCHNVDMSNITTSGNAWGGVAVYVSKPQYINRGSDNVNLNFANSTLADGIYSEDEEGLFNTNIHISGYTYGINNEYATTPHIKNIEFYIGGTLADALDLGAGFNAKYNNKMSYVWANADPIENYYVGPGMAIQAAIDAASDGDVINVAAGTYNEAVTINKGVSVLGAGAATTTIDALSDVDKSTVVKIDTTSGDVKLDGFTIRNSTTEEAEITKVLLVSGSTGAMVEISNNIIIGGYDSATETYTDSGFGFWSSNCESNLFFHHNNISHCYDNAVGLERHRGTSEISYNTISDCAPFPAIWFMTEKSGSEAPEMYEITARQYIHHNTITTGACIGMAAPYGGHYNQYLGGKYTDVEISYNNISNLPANGKGIQLEADGDNGGFYNPVIANNTITGASGLPSTSARGIRILGNVFNADINNNTISGVYRGIWQSYSWGQPGIPGPSGNTLRNNSITDCAIGVENQYSTTDAVITLTDNQFSDNHIHVYYSGNEPDVNTLILTNTYAPTYFIKGQTIYGNGAVLYVDAPLEVIQDNVQQTYSVKASYAENLRGFTVKLVIPKADFATEPTNFVKESAFTSPLYVVDQSTDKEWIYVVTGSVLGASSVTGENVTFFTFDATSTEDYNNVPDGCYIQLPLEDVILRDEYNQPIECFDTLDKWILIDNIAPTPVVWEDEITALLHPCRTTPDANNSIDLMWTNPEDAKKIQIWTLSYGDAGDGYTSYPEYEDHSEPILTAPDPLLGSPQNGWVKAAEIDPPETFPYTLTGMDRGYYYITLFAMDEVGNISDAPEAPFYRESISYWPGDVNGDGEVKDDDLSSLGAVWGLTSSSDAWNNLIDIGPSTDYARRSRPTPDDKIDIEDLMMLAMNYYNTHYTDYHRNSPELNPVTVTLATQSSGNQVFVNLELSGNNGFLKGLNMPIAYGSGLQLVSVEQGNIWPETSLLLHTNAEGLVEVSCVTLGRNALEGDGNVATLVFNVVGDDTEITPQPMIARSLDNHEITITYDCTANDDLVNVIPLESYLGSNYPNPFNPSTTIQYGLKEAGSVRINVYNSRGQLVRTLVDENKAAGTYRVVWDGKDGRNRSVSSGIYYFRMEAKGCMKTNKGILIK
jgi:hypothetical protein